MPDLALTSLDDLAVIAVRGTDARSFLQGQLSHDIAALPERGALLAGLHNPQGRCLAVMRVLCLAPEHLLLVLPADIAGSVRAQLQRYVLRARVTLEDANPVWRVYGATGADAAAAASLRVSMPVDAGACRQLIIAPRGEPRPDGDAADREDWRLADIEAGLPEIVQATAGQFVAQMLNLDLIGAVSFEKGCYTGQEVIARAHYRGQVKRRMQRFHTTDDAALPPGARIRLGDGRAAHVVMSAPAHDGGQQFLAVTTLPGTGTDGEAAAEAGAAAPPVAGIDCTPLPLPYAPLAR